MGLRRYEKLSRPRGFHPDYVKDRVSVYWVDSLPTLPANGRTEYNMTSRQEELGKPRKRAYHYTHSFDSAMRPVSQGAKKYVPSPRIEELARHKNPHPQYIPPRGPMTDVPDSALKVTASARVQQLARTKTFASPPIVTPQRWDWTDWKDRISSSALLAKSSERIEMLARPKTSPPSFRFPRPVMWPVTEQARSTQASEHVVKLSRPFPRKLINDDYDPFVVSKAALSGRLTARIALLATPSPRKVLAK